MKKLTIADYKLIDKVTAIDVIAVTSNLENIYDYSTAMNRIKTIIDSPELPHNHISLIEFELYIKTKYND